jgi:hypothetical protein
VREDRIGGYVHPNSTRWLGGPMSYEKVSGHGKPNRSMSSNTGISVNAKKSKTNNIERNLRNRLFPTAA